RDPGRHVFFQVGEGHVLLAFLAETTLKGDQLPAHGATGPGHFALGVDADAFDAWRNLLQGHGVVIEREMDWPRGGKSIYFLDPAGNSVELVTLGVWGLPSGVVSDAELHLRDLRDAASRRGLPGSCGWGMVRGWGVVSDHAPTRGEP